MAPARNLPPSDHVAQLGHTTAGASQSSLQAKGDKGAYDQVVSHRSPGRTVGLLSDQPLFLPGLFCVCR